VSDFKRAVARMHLLYAGVIHWALQHEVEKARREHLATLDAKPCAGCDAVITIEAKVCPHCWHVDPQTLTQR
jgi:hypothetical protein